MAEAKAAKKHKTDGTGVVKTNKADPEFRGVAQVMSDLKHKFGTTVRFDDADRIARNELDFSSGILTKLTTTNFLVHKDDLFRLATMMNDYLNRFVRLADSKLPDGLYSRDIGKMILETGKPGELWRGIRVNNIGEGVWTRLRIHEDDLPLLAAAAAVV